MPDKQLDTLTLEEFVQEFKRLLRRADDSGLDAEEFCQLAEKILQAGWGE